MYLHPIHFPIPSYSPSAPVPHPIKQNLRGKSGREKNKQTFFFKEWRLGPVLLSCPQGWLYYTNSTRASFIVLPRWGRGVTLRGAAAFAGQGQPLHSLRPQRQLFHLSQSLSVGHEGRRHLSSAYVTKCQMRNGENSHWLTTLGLGQPHFQPPDHQASSAVLPRWGVGTTFLSVAAGKGEGELSYLL